MYVFPELLSCIELSSYRAIGQRRVVARAALAGEEGKSYRAMEQRAKSEEGKSEEGTFEERGGKELSVSSYGAKRERAIGQL